MGCFNKLVAVGLLGTAWGCTTENAVSAGPSPDAAVEAKISQRIPHDADPPRPPTPPQKTEPPDMIVVVAPPRSDAEIASRADASATPDAPRSDGNRSDGRDNTGTAADAAPLPAGKAVLIAVGYQGRRVVSMDLGATWIGDQISGGAGDDQHLLRDAAAGAGRLVAVGWRFWSSVDGLSWTEHKNPHGQWQGGVAFGNRIFVASGGLGNSATSTDGITWKRMPNAGSAHIRRVTFKDGVFWATSDSGTVYSTTNGSAWKVGGQFPVEPEVVGTLSARLKNGVELSQDSGATWKSVFRGGNWAGVGVGFPGN